jgi:hypothetical protein
MNLRRLEVDKADWHIVHGPPSDKDSVCSQASTWAGREDLGAGKNNNPCKEGAVPELRFKGGTSLSKVFGLTDSRKTSIFRSTALPSWRQLRIFGPLSVRQVLDKFCSPTPSLPYRALIAHSCWHLRLPTPLKFSCLSAFALHPSRESTRLMPLPFPETPVAYEALDEDKP